jgi:tetratricopeptide (TPR) repeat protein
VKILLCITISSNLIALSGASTTPRTASDWNNAGNTFYSSAQYSQAEQYFKKALEIERSQQPSNTAELATTSFNLAAVYRSEARYEEARPLYLEALALRERLFGPNHAELVNPLIGLALLNLDCGNLKVAENLGTRALRLAEQGESVKAAEVRNDLAGILFAEGKYREAHSLIEPILAVNPDGTRADQDTACECLEYRRTHRPC